MWLVTAVACHPSSFCGLSSHFSSPLSFYPRPPSHLSRRQFHSRFRYCSEVDPAVQISALSGPQERGESGPPGSIPREKQATVVPASSVPRWVWSCVLCHRSHRLQPPWMVRAPSLEGSVPALGEALGEMGRWTHPWALSFLREELGTRIVHLFIQTKKVRRAVPFTCG